MLELYRGLFDDNVNDESLIEDCSLEGVLFKNRRNDLSFRVRNRRIVVLAEHQSTLNENMPLRFLIYLGRVYERLINGEDIYKKKRMALDVPQFVVFYNGGQEAPEYQELRLSDAIQSFGDCSIELVVKVYNITYSADKKILQKIALLKDYSFFVNEVESRYKETADLSMAISQAMDFCISKNVLKDVLTNLGSEVKNMLTQEFDIEVAERIWRAESEAIGEARGKAEIILNMYSNGITPEQIAKLTGESLKEVEVIVKTSKFNH